MLGYISNAYLEGIKKVHAGGLILHINLLKIFFLNCMPVYKGYKRSQSYIHAIYIFHVMFLTNFCT